MKKTILAAALLAATSANATIFTLDATTSITFGAEDPPQTVQMGYVQGFFQVANDRLVDWFFTDGWRKPIQPYPEDAFTSDSVSYSHQINTGFGASEHLSVGFSLPWEDIYLTMAGPLTGTIAVTGRYDEYDLVGTVTAHTDDYDNPYTYTKPSNGSVSPAPEPSTWAIMVAGA